MFGLLCAGAARKCCIMLQLTDGWLMLKTNYQLCMSGSKREEKEERCLVEVKPMICPRMVICYLIFSCIVQLTGILGGPGAVNWVEVIIF